jgi:hypothetical protein
MENSIFLAKLLGPYFIIVAIGFLFNRKAYQKVMEDFCSNFALIYIGAIFALFFGLLVVLFHNVWAANWTVIITIFGWAGIIKGIWLIVLPNSVSGFIAAFRRKSALLPVYLVILLGLGIFLSVRGYFPG